MTWIASVASTGAGSSSSPDRSTSSRRRMQAASEWSGEASQYSPIASAKRLTFAVTRAASLASSPLRTTSRYRVCSISSKKRSRTSMCRAAAPRSSTSGTSAAVAGLASTRDMATRSALSRRTRSIAIRSLTSGRSWKPWPPITTCGRRAAAKLLRQPVGVAADQRRGGGDDAARAAAIAAERDRARCRKAAQEAFEACPRRAAESVDRLVVVADDERSRIAGDQLDKSLLGEVQILVFVDQHMRVSRRITALQRRFLLEHPDGQQEQVVEVQQPAFAALPFVGAEQPHARAHQLRTLDVFCGRGPCLEPGERNQLLLHSLEPLEDRPGQVARPLVWRERCDADAPPQLAGEDPAVRSRDDPEVGRHSDAAAVLAQPAQGDRVEGADGRRGRLDQVFDALAHLTCRALGECHDQDRRGRDARCDKAAKSLGDDGCLAGAGTGHDADRTTPQGGRAALLDAQAARHSVIVGLPIRTRNVRTRRPRSARFNLATMVSESRRSWCARAGLEVVTTRVPECSSTWSQRGATSGPRMARNATATWVPNRRAPPGCRRRIFGSILPNLSTGPDRPLVHRPDHRAGDQIGRERARLDRGHDHLPTGRDLLEEGRPALAVKLGKHVVK